MPNDKRQTSDGGRPVGVREYPAECEVPDGVWLSFKPQPIRGVEIPREHGKKRLLGIPAVTDRMLQQAVHQIIYPLFEVEFKSGSYGFRPKCNAHQAVLAAQRYVNEGYNHIVDIDLKTFFDEDDHCIHREAR